MKSKLIFLTVTLAFFSFNALAQIAAPKETPVLKDSTNDFGANDFNVGEVKGTIQNKAIHLAKPVYTLEARQAGAEGAVRMQITIGEEGTVLAANMISGDPLLKSAAEDAARKSKFRIARNADGNAVKTEGVLVYNFTFQKANWSRIGYGLSLLNRLPAASFHVPGAKKAFASEWTTELQMLEKLDEIRRAEPPPPKSPFADAPKPILMNNSASGAASSDALIVRRLYVPPTPSAEQIALAQNLVSALQNRLENDASASWQFNLGLDLHRAMEMQRYPNARAESAQIIRRNIEKAPQTTSKEVISALEDLVRFFERTKETVDTQNEIGRALSVIFNSK